MRILTLTRLMTLSALVAVPYGVFCLFLPQAWLELIGGLRLEGQGILVARMYGTQLIGFGVTSWLGRGVPDSPARQAMIRGFVVVDSLSLGLAVWAQAAGWVGPEGWVDVVGFAFFALAFGYYARRPRAG